MDNASNQAQPNDPTPEEASAAEANSQVPVPREMSPAELDARGDAVNAVQRDQGLPVPSTHDEDRGASYA